MSGYKIDQKIDMEGRKIYDDKLFRQAMGRTLSLPIHERVLGDNGTWRIVDGKHRLVFSVNNMILERPDSKKMYQSYYIDFEENRNLISRQEIFNLQDKWVLLPETESETNKIIITKKKKQQLCKCTFPKVSVHTYICSVCNKEHESKNW